MSNLYFFIALNYSILCFTSLLNLGFHLPLVPYLLDNCFTSFGLVFVSKAQKKGCIHKAFLISAAKRIRKTEIKSTSFNRPNFDSYLASAFVYLQRNFLLHYLRYTLA